jgi:hypothetical protein
VNAADDAVLAAWWRTFLATARLPGELELVHGRLVRSVHRGRLPSGPVHVKAMAFPRAKDRLRYLVRPLPGAHEAALLRSVAAAGVPCPEVVAVRTARRCGLPFRSLLVLRSLPVAPPAAEDGRERLRAELEIVERMLAAGIVHHDLHGGNFVRLADGRLAVLDMQSARRRAPGRAGHAAVRITLGARMLRERDGLDDEQGLAELEAARFVVGAGLAEVRRRLQVERWRWHRTRLLRCFGESTEFRRRWRWNGCEHAWRDAPLVGRWHAHPEARSVWLGQRLVHLEQGRAAAFPAYFRKWWWLGGGGALYVPATCHDGRIDAEVQAAVAAAVRADRILAGVAPTKT